MPRLGGGGVRHCAFPVRERMGMQVPVCGPGAAQWLERLSAGGAATARAPSGALPDPRAAARCLSPGVTSVAQRLSGEAQSQHRATPEQQAWAPAIRRRLSHLTPRRRALESWKQRTDVLISLRAAPQPQVRMQMNRQRSPLTSTTKVNTALPLVTCTGCGGVSTPEYFSVPCTLPPTRPPHTPNVQRAPTRP